jgi:histone acetyltransferase (RNA polymerase elongator complex component)
MTPKRRVIPVFVPHLGCPECCVFCNQRRISGSLKPAAPEEVRRVLEETYRTIPPNAPAQLAFFGGSFTAIPVQAQRELLDAALPFLHSNRNLTLRISTRPDCINEDTLKRLESYRVKTIELGAQSMGDDVLKKSGRSHTPEDTVRAARLIKEYGFELVLQMMTGLPGDTPEKSVMTAKKLIELNPDGVRIYPTVILKDTRLYELWQEGAYREHTVEDAVQLCAELLDLFEKAGIPVIRLGLNPTEDLSGGDAAGGAYHPAFGELVYARAYLNKARALLQNTPSGAQVTLGVSPGSISKMTGQKRCNIVALEGEFGLKKVKVKSADAAPGEIVILSIEKGP